MIEKTISRLNVLWKISSNKESQFYVDVFTEFVEVLLLNQNIYLSDIYPASIFETRRKFNLPLHMSQHPWVNEYIRKVVYSLRENLTQPDFNIQPSWAVTTRYVRS